MAYVHINSFQDAVELAQDYFNEKVHELEKEVDELKETIQTLEKENEELKADFSKNRIY